MIGFVGVKDGQPTKGKDADNIDLMEFFKQYNQPIYDYIYFRCNRSEPDSDDILQETFLDLHKYLRKKNIQVSFELAAKVARNNIIDFYRKKKASHRPRVFADFASEQKSDLLFEKLDINEIEDDSDIPELVGRALSALNPLYRKVLFFRYEDELSHEEIAEELSKSIDSVKSIIKRARTSFRRAYTAANKQSL